MSGSVLGNNDEKMDARFVCWRLGAGCLWGQCQCDASAMGGAPLISGLDGKDATLYWMVYAPEYN